MEDSLEFLILLSTPPSPEIIGVGHSAHDSVLLGVDPVASYVSNKHSPTELHRPPQTLILILYFMDESERQGNTFPRATDRGVRNDAQAACFRAQATHQVGCSCFLLREFSRVTEREHTT